MRIAVSAEGPGLDSPVDPRFGRCRCLILVDPDTGEFEAVENTGQAATGGAGIATAQLVAGKEVVAVLTGNCGPNAYRTLQAAGIEVITGVSGTVREAIEKYRTGGLQASSGPSVQAHAGMRTDSESNVTSESTGYSRQLETLKVQTQDMRNELSQIMDRLDRIEKGLSS
ncbi:MAG: NifB/NifX family molybdenum-iron cluster-binding protein [Dehalococcoidia bacterium]|nr:NifB/NifX family molybdenum-iron cluster-binding protein [Dehalococcoidia bacterium]